MIFLSCIHDNDEKDDNLDGMNIPLMKNLKRAKTIFHPSKYLIFPCKDKIHYISKYWSPQNIYYFPVRPKYSTPQNIYHSPAKTLRKRCLGSARL